jgi:hypothetical protein
VTDATGHELGARPETSPAQARRRPAEWRRLAASALPAVALVLVVGAAAWPRLSGSDWDAGHRLHPDERYLSLVADNLRFPDSLDSYLDVETSPLSPYNTRVGRDYVYGTLPLFATKAVADAIGHGAYGDLYLVGRRLGALLDLATIVLVFLLARLVLARAGPRPALLGALLAAGLYGFTVTAIQHAHFATVEAWLTFFGTLTIYLAARAIAQPVDSRVRLELAWGAVGIALALTVACKVSGAIVALPVAVAVLGRTTLWTWAFGLREAAVRLAGAVLALLVPGYLAYRLVSPYTFASSSWFDLSINPSYRDALMRQQDALQGAVLPPPSYQWLLSRRYWDPLENLVVWQLGVPLGVLAVAGVVAIAVRLARSLRPEALRRARAGSAPEPIQHIAICAMILAFVVGSFGYFAGLFAHTGRYLVPLAPILAVAASFFLVTLLDARPRVLAAAAALVGGATILYAVAFHSIYTRPNTRVAATEWIVSNVPAGSTIANEHWDDPLPVRGIWADTEADALRQHGYRGTFVPAFDADDSAKLEKLHDALATADYYVVSSPRAWKTVGRLPDRFPVMARFYDELFAGRLGFERAAEFSSYPELFGTRIDDGRAEEAFWVYDHAPVTIFRRSRSFSLQDLRQRLCPADERAPCPS